MAIDEKYIPITSLNQAFLDKDTGLPLANGQLWFYNDNSRSQPKTVYQLTNGPDDYTYVALPNPVSLSSIGTVENGSGENCIIYAYPYNDAEDSIELYYVRCLSSAGVEQWTRGAIPHIGETIDPTNDSYSLENALSNAQFSQYFLPNAETTINVNGTGTLTIAPDWAIDYASSGPATITLERVPVAGTDAVPLNPAYYLTIETDSNITACQLRQRLNVNSGLWAGKSLATTITGQTVSGQSNAVNIYYSDGTTATPILTKTFPSGTWDIVDEPTTLDPSTNGVTSPNTYVDIYVEIPSFTKFAVTNIQVVQVPSEEVGSGLPYQERSSNREQAMMGDWYIPRLGQIPTRNYLVGWDFNLNPAQFGESGTITQDATGGNGEYIWDQTIAARAGGDFDYARDALTGGLTLTASTDSTAAYVLQYLEGPDAKRLLTSKLAVNVNAYISGGNTTNPVTARVYIFGAPSGAAFPVLPLSAVTCQANGQVALTAAAQSAGWFRVGRNGLDQLTPAAETSAQSALGVADSAALINTANVDYHFNQWEVTGAQMASFDKVAVVVSFACSNSGQVVTVNSISLQPGDIATRPLPQTAEEVLRDCEYYYEMSYENAADVGTITPNGKKVERMAAYYAGGTNLRYGITSFSVDFTTSKRAINATKPVTFFSPLTAAPTGEDKARFRVFSALTTIHNADIDMDLAAASPLFNLDGVSVDRVKYNKISVAADANGGNAGTEYANLEYHYVVDSRIGIV